MCSKFPALFIREPAINTASNERQESWFYSRRLAYRIFDRFEALEDCRSFPSAEYMHK